jgi:hypothetical protein
MLTRDVDAGLYAIDRCRAALPAMLRHYGPESPERAALTELLTTVLRASDAMAWKPADRAEAPGLNGDTRAPRAG